MFTANTADTECNRTDSMRIGSDRIRYRFVLHFDDFLDFGDLLCFKGTDLQCFEEREGALLWSSSSSIRDDGDDDDDEIEGMDRLF